MPKYKIIAHKDAPLPNDKPITADHMELDGKGGVSFSRQNLTKTPGVTGQPERLMVAHFPQVGGVYELTGKELHDADVEESKEKEQVEKDNAPKPAPAHK